MLSAPASTRMLGCLQSTDVVRHSGALLAYYACVRFHEHCRVGHGAVSCDFMMTDVARRGYAFRRLHAISDHAPETNFGKRLRVECI